MDKKDSIVTELVIQSLRLNDRLKHSEVKIEQLSSENLELKSTIIQLKALLQAYVPNVAKQLDLFNI